MWKLHEIHTQCASLTILWEHNHTHLFPYVYGCFYAAAIELRQCLCGPESLKISLSGPLWEVCQAMTYGIIFHTESLSLSAIGIAVQLFLFSFPLITKVLQTSYLMIPC